MCGDDHACHCRPPDSSNLLANPGFESGQGVSNWSPTKAATWSNVDADGCPKSGSAAVKYDGSTGDFGMISECVKVSANKQYHFGFRYNQSLGTGVVCFFYFFAGSTCSGSVLDGPNITGISSAVTTWLSATGSATSPSNAGSLQVMCQEEAGGNGALDQIFVSASVTHY